MIGSMAQAASTLAPLIRSTRPHHGTHPTLVGSTAVRPPHPNHHPSRRHASCARDDGWVHRLYLTRGRLLNTAGTLAPHALGRRSRADRHALDPRSRGFRATLSECCTGRVPSHSTTEAVRALAPSCSQSKAAHGRMASERCDANGECRQSRSCGAEWRRLDPSRSTPRGIHKARAGSSGTPHRTGPHE